MEWVERSVSHDVSENIISKNEMKDVDVLWE